MDLARETTPDQVGRGTGVAVSCALLPICELRLEQPSGKSVRVSPLENSLSLCITQSLFDSVFCRLIQKRVQARLKCIRFSSVSRSKIVCCANVKKSLQKHSNLT